jgi:glycosyltransferase involved in cell wall biosynthesis
LKVRTIGDADFKFSNRRRHCGSIPVNVLKAAGINSSVRVKHLGWMKPGDRGKKYLERLQDDPNNEFYPEETYDAILEPYPTLVKWDDNNPWQTSKLTIAYPPGMEWNIMQQRPHHLLKLAAGERNRVIFGDDSAPGTYEPLPYLTVVNGAYFNWFDEVDILYITSPEQMKCCGNIKYKKLVYDCCDWQNEVDKELIIEADYILCASRLLFDKVQDLIFNSGYALVSKWGGSKVIYLPNACDFDHFSKTGEAGTMLGEKLPEPIVGYMGCIHPTMIDTKIVETLADKFKLLFIGQNKGMELKHPNIYETGHKSYQDLPKFLSAAQVGIIPFRTDSDYLRYSAPIKVYEYLAAGRPVVASNIPELRPLADSGLIYIVENEDPEVWIHVVELAMNDYPNIKGQEWAGTQTWADRWGVLKREVLTNV